MPQASHYPLVQMLKICFRALKLAYTSYKSITASNQSPIVIIHGLLGNKMNWRSIAKSLNSRDFGRVIMCTIHPMHLHRFSVLTQGITARARGPKIAAMKQWQKTFLTLSINSMLLTFPLLATVWVEKLA